MFPPFLLAARIGEAVGSMHSEQYAENLEINLAESEQYSWELEQQLESLSEQYHELAKNAGVLVDHIKAIEVERNQLFEKSNDLQQENDRLQKIIADLRSRRRPT